MIEATGKRTVKSPFFFFFRYQWSFIGGQGLSSGEMVAAEALGGCNCASNSQSAMDDGSSLKQGHRHIENKTTFPKKLKYNPQNVKLPFCGFFVFLQKLNHYESNKTNHRSICPAYSHGLQRTKQTRSQTIK